eukprot:5891788-Pyramimonas_sp.AAC.1
MRGVPVDRTEVASKTAGERCGVMATDGSALKGVAFMGVASENAASAAGGDFGPAPALPVSCTRRAFTGG